MLLLRDRACLCLKTRHLEKNNTTITFGSNLKSLVSFRRDLLLDAIKEISVVTFLPRQGNWAMGTPWFLTGGHYLGNWLHNNQGIFGKIWSLIPRRWYSSEGFFFFYNVDMLPISLTPTKQEWMDIHLGYFGILCQVI